jgi:hypothetical protein
MLSTKRVERLDIRDQSRITASVNHSPFLLLRGLREQPPPSHDLAGRAPLRPPRASRCVSPQLSPLPVLHFLIGDLLPWITPDPMRSVAATHPRAPASSTTLRNFWALQHVGAGCAVPTLTPSGRPPD